MSTTVSFLLSPISFAIAAISLYKMSFITLVSQGRVSPDTALASSDEGASRERKDLDIGKKKRMTESGIQETDSVKISCSRFHHDYAFSLLELTSKPFIYIDI